MLYKCELCGRGVQYGVSHTHKRGVAGGQWKKKAQSVRKVFKPNLRWVKMDIDGKMVRVRLCTKCGRIAKASRLGKK